MFNFEINRNIEKVIVEVVSVNNKFCTYYILSQSYL